jgi:hypothetical protein
LYSGGIHTVFVKAVDNEKKGLRELNHLTGFDGASPSPVKIEMQLKEPSHAFFGVFNRIIRSRSIPVVIHLAIVERTLTGGMGMMESFRIVDRTIIPLRCGKRHKHWSASISSFSMVDESTFE